MKSSLRRGNCFALIGTIKVVFQLEREGLLLISATFLANTTRDIRGYFESAHRDTALFFSSRQTRLQSGTRAAVGGRDPIVFIIATETSDHSQQTVDDRRGFRLRTSNHTRFVDTMMPPKPRTPAGKGDTLALVSHRDTLALDGECRSRLQDDTFKTTPSPSPASATTALPPVNLQGESPRCTHRCSIGREHKPAARCSKPAARSLVKCSALSSLDTLKLLTQPHSPKLSRCLPPAPTFPPQPRLQMARSPPFLLRRSLPSPGASLPQRASVT